MEQIGIEIEMRGQPAVVEFDWHLGARSTLISGTLTVQGEEPETIAVCLVPDFDAMQMIYDQTKLDHPAMAKAWEFYFGLWEELRSATSELLVLGWDYKIGGPCICVNFPGTSTATERQLEATTAHSIAFREALAQIIEMTDPPYTEAAGALHAIRELAEGALRDPSPKEPEPLTIWTHAYRPFVMGGSCNYILGTIIEDPGSAFDLGEGYYGFLIQNPNGETCVAEAESGALVGPDIETVRKDIDEADRQVMARQMRDAMRDAKKVELVSNEEFWRSMK